MLDEARSGNEISVSEPSSQATMAVAFCSENPS